MRSLTAEAPATPHASSAESERAPAASGTGRSVRPLKVMFLVRSLEYGGAERQLVVLAKALNDRGHAISVVTFYSGGALEPELRSTGVRVRSLEKRGRWDLASLVVRLPRVIREERPDVLHGYLGTPNIATTMVSPLFPGTPTVWGERASNMDLSHYDWLSRVSSDACRVLSRFPNLLIVNSRAGLKHATDRGYPPAKLVVIPNGIDTDRFAPDPIGGRRLRHEWNVGDGVRLVGLVSRFDPVKDHRTFLSAAADVARAREDVRFACVGDGDPQYRHAMQRLAHALGIADRVLWIGARSDVAAVYSALDVSCSSSASEGFPNAVGEAMACGVPCVVTDVGDCAWLVEDPRLIVPRGDSATLAERIELVLSLDPLERNRLCGELRNRVLAQFSVANLADATERALLALCDNSR